MIHTTLQLGHQLPQRKRRREGASDQPKSEPEYTLCLPPPPLPHRSASPCGTVSLHWLMAGAAWASAESAAWALGMAEAFTSKSAVPPPPPHEAVLSNFLPHAGFCRPACINHHPTIVVHLPRLPHPPYLLHSTPSPSLASLPPPPQVPSGPGAAHPRGDPAPHGPARNDRPGQLCRLQRGATSGRQRRPGGCALPAAHAAAVRLG